MIEKDSSETIILRTFVKEVKVTIGGKTNKLYAGNLQAENTYEQMLKLFLSVLK